MMNPKLKKWGIRVALGTILVNIIAGILAIVFQEKLIYHPFRYPDFIQPGKGITKNFRPYTATDGKVQYGCLIEPSAPVAIRPNPEFYLVFNGNGSVARDMVGYFQPLADTLGCTFFMADYRGYGFNDGKPSEAGLTADGIGAYDSMKKEGRMENGVGIIGISMGGGVTYAVAASRPCDRVITLATFSSIDDVARRRSPWPYYKFLRHHWRNDLRLAELLSRPAGERPDGVYILHGKKDWLVPFKLGEKLAATPGEGLRFIAFDDGTHFNICDVALPELKNILATGLAARAPTEQGAE